MTDLILWAMSAIYSLLIDLENLTEFLAGLWQRLGLLLGEVM